MADTLATRLKAIAAKSTTPDDEKPALEKLAADHEPTEQRPRLLPARLQAADSKTRRPSPRSPPSCTEEHKWLTPRELDEAKITDKDHMHPFIEWASELQDQKRQFDANPQSAPRLTEVERRAIEVAMRLLTYKAYSGDRLKTSRS